MDSPRLVPNHKQVPEKLTHVVTNGTIMTQGSEDVAGNEVVANDQSRQNGTTATETGELAALIFALREFGVMFLKSSSVKRYFATFLTGTG